MNYSNVSNATSTIGNRHHLKNIKDSGVVKKIFQALSEMKALEIIKYNKSIKKKLDINIKDYKDYSELIEIEVIPIKDEYLKKNHFIISILMIMKKKLSVILIQKMIMFRK